MIIGVINDADSVERMKSDIYRTFHHMADAIIVPIATSPVQSRYDRHTVLKTKQIPKGRINNESDDRKFDDGGVTQTIFANITTIGVAEKVYTFW